MGVAVNENKGNTAYNSYTQNLQTEAFTPAVGDHVKPRLCVKKTRFYMIANTWTPKTRTRLYSIGIMGSPPAWTLPPRFICRLGDNALAWPVAVVCPIVPDHCLCRLRWSPAAKNVACWILHRFPAAGSLSNHIFDVSLPICWRCLDGLQVALSDGSRAPPARKRGFCRPVPGFIAHRHIVEACGDKRIRHAVSGASN